jgi:1,2-diacylglycerol 3-beta-glucosyltransferase
MTNRTVLISLFLAICIGAWALDRWVLGGSALNLLLASIVAISATHIVWLLAVQVKWHKERKEHPFEVTPLEWAPYINIFVAAKNESRVIETCVRNLFKIDYPNFDIWVIDDASTDNTLEILEGLQAELPRLNVLARTPGSVPGKSAALNECLPLCKGDIVAVFDADSFVKPDFFRIVVPLLKDDEVGAVQAQKKIYEHQEGFLVDCQASEYAFDTCLQMGRTLVGGAVELRGNGQLVKREALVDVGGWNNNSITDDLDLSMRLLIHRYDIKFCPDTAVFEEGVETFRSLFRQRRRWAEGSIRRYLDYIIPLQFPSHASLVERFDILSFLVEFAWPALTFLAVAQAVNDTLHGVPNDAPMLVAVSIFALITIFVPLYAGLRFYRKDLSPWAAFVNAFIVNSYIFTLWSPCVVVSIWQIIFRSKASAWKPTQHFGSVESTTQLTDAGSSV